MKFLIPFSLAVFLFLPFANTSHATPITFAYEGIVNDTDGPRESAAFDAFLGETLKLVYTFESTTPDRNNSANGDYIGAVTAVSITVGKNTYTANTGNIIIINNHVNPDQYLVDIPTGLLGPAVGGLRVADFDLNFTDNSHTAYTSDALPTVQPDPSVFTSASIWLSFFDPYSFSFDHGTIMAMNNVHAAPVPEPATLFLLGTGLAGLAGGFRKRFKK